MLCTRCGRTIYKYRTCNYCKRKICESCVKSSRKMSKTIKLVICKDCWGKMPSRKVFKSARKET